MRNTNESYTTAKSRRRPTRTSSPTSSDGLLQSSDGKGLHHRLRWLCLHHHDLTENLSLSSLGCRLDAGLHHDYSRDGEFALLHFLACHLSQAIQDLLNVTLLHGAALLEGSPM